MTQHEASTAEMMAAILPVSFTLPKEFILLYDWLDTQGHLTLCPPNTWDGTDITFHIPDPDTLPDLIGNHHGEDGIRWVPFAHTGGDGSEAGFWLDEAGIQRIVHIGSGSGSILDCVLVDTPLDFLRLLAIGYDEICWIEDTGTLPPALNEEDTDGWQDSIENKPYREWLRSTFNVTIPTTALEVVSHPERLQDERNTDDFAHWWCEACSQEVRSKW